QGEDVLTGAAEVKLDLAPGTVQFQKERKSKKSTPRKNNSSLYEILKELRRRIAGMRGVPLYAVLTNADLEQLSEKRPLTAEEAVKLPGIGERKAKRILPPFLEAIRQFNESER
ncbi:MAG: HRDC domain-containing protein, partial [Lentisphaeria bacterium]|nr:HRDC domain-containing protein [Lentisphaeria bacterium]